jgi:inosine-uridine nucleoside N-ribohydrolase
MSLARLVWSVAVAVAVACACAGGGGGSDGSARAVVIDSDGAFDDLKAILYLLEQPDVEVLAITMSGTGVAHCPDAAENASAVLARVGAPDIPIACGRGTPLVGSNEAPAAWREAADSLGGVELPAPRPLSDLAAPELLAETISSSDREVVLVALGPLTNVAEAIEVSPTFLDQVETIYFMGGAVDVGGNVMYANPSAEFNVWADPHAAAVVFAADVPITLIPLDATNEVPVTPYLYDAVAAHRDASPTSAFLGDYLDANPLVGGWYHWDEFAAVVTVDESVTKFEDRTLVVVEEGGPEAGATVDSADGRPVRVARGADRGAFESRFYEAIIGKTDPGVPPWEPDATLTWDGDTCSYTGPDQLPDRVVVQIDNAGPAPMALITGNYSPDATTTDLDAYRASGGTESIDWWGQQALIGVPTGAHDVWVIDGGPDITAVCYVDASQLWEVAGPRLPDIAG